LAGRVTNVAGVGRVGVVFRGPGPDARPDPRLDAMCTALVEEGLEVLAVPYLEGRAHETAARLSVVEGILVWVDPLGENGDRHELDEVLRAAVRAGGWVGAHPDVVDLLGTKEVLVHTRDLSWGCDVHLYRTAEELGREFPRRLAAHGVRVLKADRGNGGRRVWKVRVANGTDDAPVRPDTVVVVQHAEVRDGSSVLMRLGALMKECSVGFEAWGGSGRLVDQEFIGGVTRGVVRCYLVGAEVVGFARQYPAGARPLGPLAVDVASGPSAEEVMGLPSPKTMYPPDEPAFADLRQRLEGEWVPGMVERLRLDLDELPALWDIDLLIAEPGPESPAVPGDRFVLCEVNASCVIPFPPEAPSKVAAHVSRALGSRSVAER
jgi:hypothetical protein